MAKITMQSSRMGHSTARGKIAEKGKVGSKLSSPGGLLNSFTGQSNVTPKVTAAWDQNEVKNSLRGKGKIPGGNTNNYTARGAGMTPASKMSATKGAPLAGGSASNKSGVSLKGDAAGRSKANSPAGNKALTSMVLKKNSTTGQSQTNFKAPKSEPKASGVPVAKSVNWHQKLGFGGQSKE